MEHTPTPRELAKADFSIMLEDRMILEGQLGTIFFASARKWTEALLYSRIKYEATISKRFNHETYGPGWAIFVPD